MDEPADIGTRRRRGTSFTIGGNPRSDRTGSSGQTDPAVEESAQTFEFRDDAASSPTVKRGRRPKADLTAAKGSAELLIGCVETIAYGRYRRPDAFMAPVERKMAVDGLAQSVKVLPADVVAQISSLSAPVMACFGFALYFMRLGELEQRHRAERRDERVSAGADDILSRQPVYPTEEYGNPPSPNGSGPSVPPLDLIRGLQES